ncbi:MAG: hypothetical protein L0F95_01810 [Lactococcus sp.]|nr:hypothetical protein [Lactococcus sp.]MDN5411132.1 hypothetical protein [Lactococcus sp.]
MALVTRQTVSLNGDSRVNNQIIATFSARIPQGSGNSNVSMDITNQQLYELNKKEVREDQAAFQARVYEIEDSLTAE